MDLANSRLGVLITSNHQRQGAIATRHAMPNRSHHGYLVMALIIVVVVVIGCDSNTDIAPIVAPRVGQAHDSQSPSTPRPSCYCHIQSQLQQPWWSKPWPSSNAMTNDSTCIWWLDVMRTIKPVLTWWLVYSRSPISAVSNSARCNTTEMLLANPFMTRTASARSMWCVGSMSDDRLESAVAMMGSGGNKWWCIVLGGLVDTSLS